MTESTVDQRVAGVPSLAPRQRAVFVVTALGAFMASLDLSIVNVAFPALEHSFPHDSPGHPGLGDHRLQHRVRLSARHRRPHRRPARSPAGVLRRAGRLHAGSALCGLAPSVALLVGGPVHPGRAGRPPCCRPRSGCCSAPSPVERRSQVVALWGGIGALAVATGPRSAPPSSRPAGGGGSSSSTCPSARWPSWWAGGS